MPRFVFHDLTSIYRELAMPYFVFYADLGLREAHEPARCQRAARSRASPASSASAKSIRALTCEYKAFHEEALLRADLHPRETAIGQGRSFALAQC